MIEITEETAAVCIKALADQTRELEHRLVFEVQVVAATNRRCQAARESHVTEMEKANHTVEVLRGRQADERAALAILGIRVNEIPSFNPEEEATGMVSYTAGGVPHGSAVDAAWERHGTRPLRDAMERELAVLREEVATFRGDAVERELAVLRKELLAVGGGDVQHEAEAEPDNDPDGDHACEDLRGVATL